MATRKQAIQLTDDQLTAITNAGVWYQHEHGPVYAIGGYAGTGKTTIIKEIIRTHTHAAVCAFTGKAVSVLKHKGVPATTMHSLMYYAEKDLDGKITFHRRAQLPTNLVIIDEASMVNRMLYEDLCSFHPRILLVGDPGQLEPIGKDPSLMANPDFVLQTIHRQAEQSDIIQFSILVRSGKSPLLFKQQNCDQVEVGDYRRFVEVAGEVDQCICGYNKTRHYINVEMRKARGFNTMPVWYDSLDFELPSGMPQVGDRVICLQNNRTVGVFNGLMGTIQEVHKTFTGWMVADILDEAGTLHKQLDVALDFFGNSKTEWIKGERPTVTYWDYGYCVTCHKAQGSEFDSVAVFEQIHPKWDAKRWRYTACTRAAERLVYCVPR